MTARKLRAIGIVQLVDVRAVDGRLLTNTVGSLAEWLRQLSHGVDDRPVVPDRARKSCGTENTFPKDLVDRDEIRLTWIRWPVRTRSGSGKRGCWLAR